MKMSQLSMWPEKRAPKEADTVNHRLLVQGAFVRQLMAGVYSYLPFGLRVLNNISNIVREEMNAVGGQEVLMPILHPAEIWKTTGGWESIDVLFKLKSRTDKELALGQSQEEVVTPLMKEFIRSYRDLPAAVYHIQWKYRDELRSKSGILRGREFLMKDLYSFHEDQGDFERFYDVAKKAYMKIFKRLGLIAKVTEASGGAFSEKISYEFEVITDAGEANILYCDACDFCVNVDDIQTHKESDKCPRCGQSTLLPAKAAEVGNVFDLGQKYSKNFEMTFADRNGNPQFPIMGCYGIGISRTMGVIVEKFNDAKGIVWPDEVAPYKVSLISLGETGDRASDLYLSLSAAGVETLLDDRDLPAGVKFADADLIGNPWRLVVSDKSLSMGGVELKRRDEEKTEIVLLDEIVRRLA